jgi:hypothetical protein
MPTLPALAVLIALAAPPSSGPTVAVEDTMRTTVSEVLVRAPRVTLDEILDRVARGEAHRDSLLHDQAFTSTVRVVRDVAETKKPPQLLEETVSRVYKKKPDKARTVLLHHWQKKPEKGGKDDKGGKGDNVEVNFRADMDEEIVNFAFRPSARRAFRYRIVGRDLLGSHLIYRIAFEPRSALDPSIPSGLVWVDTNDFVIVRQEVSFPRSPVPLILKSMDRMVIERQRVDGYWVLRRVLVRVQLSMPIPTIGRSFDVALQFDQYAINAGIDDSLFVKPGRAR